MLDAVDFRRNRLALARVLRDVGIQVTVVMDTTGHAPDEFDEFQVIHWTLARGSLNPVAALRSLLQVISLYRQDRPTLVHHFALKPAVFGGIAARLTPGVMAVNTITGLGVAFLSGGWSGTALRRAVVLLLRVSTRHRRSLTVFQNADDRALLARAGAVDIARTALIRGSGVDVRAFHPTPEPDGVPIVLFAGRFMREKGVEDFYLAARELRTRGIPARFVLVGEPDPEHRSSIPVQTVRDWVSTGAVEWWGTRSDMPAVIAAASVVCLPSYREGVPKVLLEAAASARAMVATDVPGCREIVRNGVSGLLVPRCDPGALAGAIQTLVDDPARRRELARNARRIVEEEFSNEQVVRQTLDVYRRLLSTHPSENSEV